jgi:hypothetical protein
MERTHYKYNPFDYITKLRLRIKKPIINEAHNLQQILSIHPKN